MASSALPVRGVVLALLFFAASAGVAQEPGGEEAPAEVEKRGESDTSAEPAAEPTPLARIEPSGWLLAPRVGEYRRQPLHVDPLEATIALGAFQPPTVGDRVAADDRIKAVWRADDGSRGADLVGGYAFVEF